MKKSYIIDKSSIGNVKVLEVNYGHNCDIATYSHMPTPSQNCGESHKLGWYVAYNANYKLSMCKALCDENEKCNHFSYNPKFVSSPALCPCISIICYPIYFVFS